MKALGPSASAALARAGVTVSDRAVRFLQARQQRRAVLTTGIPWLPERVAREWVQPRLAWWPQGIPQGRLVAVVSSRVGRDLDRRPDWFHALRVACAGLRRDDILTVVEKCAAFPFLRYCGLLFGLRLLEVHVGDSDPGNVARWLESLPRLHRPVAEGVYGLYLSPPLGAAAVPVELCRTAARDRVAVALGSRLVALHVRAGGNLQRLLQARLASKCWARPSVYVALGSPQLVGRPLGEPLMQQGAVGWYAWDAPSPAVPPQGPWPGSTRQAARPAAIVPLPADAPWPYLIHCTRRAVGPWPDQPEEEYLHELVLGMPSRDRSALATLARIVGQQKLLASSRAIRGGTPVVSFTAAPPSQLAAMRVYRPHRVRWDFEPYGLCIRRAWLESRGARPVRYGDDRSWQRLPEHLRPYFQRRLASRGTDWTGEREWRHVGDLPLHDLPVDDALVLVPSRAEAEHMSRISAWPVAVLDRYPARDTQ